MEENKNESKQETKTILIVEDDDTIRKILVIECKRKGFEVLEFRDSASAMTAIKRKKPVLSAAVVDLMNMGYGGNIGQYLRGFDIYKKTKVIYYTALTERQFNTDILNMPETYYVHKEPGSIKKVIEILEQS